MADRWRWVDSISASPTVRLDLNDQTVFEVIADDLTPPDLRRQSSASMAVDGEHVAASAFSNRVVTLTLDLLRSSTDLAATQRQSLERELARPTNILEYRPHGATSSVFFRTFRSVGNMRRVVSTNSQAYWTFDIPILAEPFAYGLKETLSTVTVASNPVSANGRFFDIAAADAKGDVETPLCWLGTNGSQWALQQTAWGVRRRGTPSSAPLFTQCESMTMGTDTTTVANGANYSPTSGTNTAETTFATNNLTTTRLTTTVPTTAGVDGRGTYRVFARVHADAASALEVELQMKIGGGGVVTPVSIDSVTRTLQGATAEPHDVDLGLIQVPVGQDPGFDGPSGSEKTVAPATLTLHARRVSGTANLVWDFLTFVPADDQFGFMSWGTALTSSEEVVMDSFNRRAYAQNASNDAVSSSFGLTRNEGGWPMITPNQTNRVVLVPAFASTAIGQDITQTYSITPYYWPRYIDVRPALT